MKERMGKVVNELVMLTCVSSLNSAGFSLSFYKIL